MLRVEMTKNLKSYRPKVFAGLDAKQLIGILLGLLVTVTLTAIFPGNLFVRAFIAFVFGLPFFMYGFLEFQGLDLLDMAKLAMKSILSGSIRVYAGEREFLGEQNAEIKQNEEPVKHVKDIRKFKTLA